MLLSANVLKHLPAIKHAISETGILGASESGSSTEENPIEPTINEPLTTEGIELIFQCKICHDG